MGRKRASYVLFFSAVVVLIGLLFPSSASAHRMLIDHETGGDIHVRYDDGASAGFALVTAYDEEGAILFERETDDNGRLDYHSELDVHRIVADDGMGHRATWTAGEETSIMDSIPLFVRAIFGISILLFIAAIFILRKHRKQEEGEKT